MSNAFVLSGVFLSLILATACQTKRAEVSNDAANTNRTTLTEERSTTSQDVQKVTIDSPDGVKLIGSFFAAETPKSPALLLLHQWQSDRHSYDDFAKRMQARGFAVLSIDGRGFGESVKTSDGRDITAERTDAAVKAMLTDVGAAFDFLAKQQNVDPAKIGIVGASYGSSLALIYAADEPKVAAAALLSPGLNYFGNMPTEPAIKKYGDRPLYMIAADDDKDSADAVKKLAAAGNNSRYGEKIYPE
ncbi:MAG TPA: alpha/beta fold hydrolase, partial [Pyrinomonadaceae bacterium]|nr:alpha/beta fold hydrolase [Pyrinomonadaceae bacterium]